MNSFDVLSSQQKIDQSYVLEASAGTGKTFAIENIVVRLLLEKPEIELERILVVTFTRAATRDLKERIRANLKRALLWLKGEKAESAPDYIRSFLQRDSKAISEGRRHLEKALFCFDTASIFTIHSFCAKILQENFMETGVGANFSQEELSRIDKDMVRVIRNFFRTELVPEHYSKNQLRQVLEEFHSVENLENEILSILKMRLEIAPQPTFEEYYLQFSKAVQHLPPLLSTHMIEDFVALAPYYTGICDRSGEIKREIAEKIEQFVGLFESSCWTEEKFDALLNVGIMYSELLSEEKRQKRKTIPNTITLHYPNLMTLLAPIKEIVDRARNPTLILSQIACGCQKLLNRYLDHEEKLTYDDLLLRMKAAVQCESFCEYIRKSYQAVIIDEFQDTDPLQWEIFRTLFLSNSEGNIYLIGDPKQSIYGFRQADVYTYLSAKEALGKETHYSLDTNYRSQPAFVKALNALFSQERTSDLLSLPRLNTSISYRDVKSSATNEPLKFKDTRKSIHFTFATQTGKGLGLEKLEKEKFFPFIANEIAHLHERDKVGFNQFAILVSDRFQANRLIGFLSQQNIPTITLKGVSLTESKALTALYDILEGVISPQNESAFKKALGSELVKWTHHQILELMDNPDYENLLAHFYSLRKALFQQGLGPFFQYLMHNAWPHFLDTLAETILKESGGKEFYDELCQLVTLLLEKETHTFHSPEQLLKLLKEILANPQAHSEQFIGQQDSSQDAVQILTMHSSKGLEFEIVFALGVVTRTRKPSHIFPFYNASLNKVQLTAVSNEDDPNYRAHCKEIDAEKLRQLYVTFTRAKQRMYVPAILQKEEPILKEGTGSPMELFLNRFKGNFIDWIASEGSQHSISFEHLEGNIPVMPLQQHFDDHSFPSIPQIKIPKKSLYVHSFTSLSRQEKQPFLDKADPIFIENDLPIGPETGVVLHRLLEELEFTQTDDMHEATELVPYVTQKLGNMALNKWITQISALLFNAMKVPLTNCGLTLSKIPIQQRFQEIEFLFPALENMPPGYIKGVIDLIFLWKDQYFILDWKSNWLGPDYLAYHPNNLKKVMEEHHYFLQADLYKEALKKYLALIDPRPFEQIYGGAFYLFLRGLSLNHPSHGVVLLK